MEITWYGLSCFRLTERKHASIVTDPYSNKLGLGTLKLRADVATISHKAPGHSYTSAVGRKALILSGPGEYEIGGVFITGIATRQNGQSPPNVAYLYDFAGITVAHLGDMSQVPSQKEIEALEEVHVLLVPVGGGTSLGAAQAAELVSMLEPNIVVPMHYDMKKLRLELDDVDRFLKEMGVTQPREESSLKVTLSGLPQETETVLLKPKL